jgi:hypothetical protein
LEAAHKHGRNAPKNRITGPCHNPEKAIFLRIAAVLVLLAVRLLAQPDLYHPAIDYYGGPANDPVALLNGKMDLKFEGPSGYLRSVLEALKIPVESQIAVFSKTSLQAPLIEPRNPRTIFFNDSVAVGWMRGGFIEIAAHDPKQGVKFYMLDQRPTDRPLFRQGKDCLRCHVGTATLSVAGMVVGSIYTAPDGAPQLIYGGTAVDHRTPFNERWGGWYVTGASPSLHHLGNAVITPGGDPKAMETLHDNFDSDVAALMLFDHQMHMINLITRIGWDTRAHMGKLQDSARELVDYMLFVEEAPFAGKLESRFAPVFAKSGPRDSKGRSLRDLDLQKRLLRYPCSYMIYSEAFDALPAQATDAIYRRMWRILSGAEKDKKYARLTTADRRAVVEILRETKKGIPDYFQVVK